MRLVTTTFFSGLTTVIKIATNFILGKLIALYSGTSGLAIIGQFSNFISIVSSVANGAITNGVIKYTSEYRDDEKLLKRVIQTSFRVSYYFAIFTSIVLMLFANKIAIILLNDRIYILPIRLLSLSLIFYSINILFVSILNGLQKIKLYTIVNAVGNLVSLVVSIFLILLYKLEGALYSMALIQVLLLSSTLFFLRKEDWINFDLFKRKIDLTFLKKLSQFSLMLIVSSLFVPISQMILRNYITYKLSIHEAGIWQGMVRISDGYLMLITTSLGTYYLPKLSSLNSKEEIRNEIIKGYKFILPLFLILGTLMFAFKNLIITTLYSSDFLEMRNLFLLQLIGDLFKISSWLLAFQMTAKAMTKMFIITEVIFSISYICLGVFFIDYIGFNGITYAYSINYLLYLIFMIYIFRSVLFEKK